MPGCSPGAGLDRGVAVQIEVEKLTAEWEHFSHTYSPEELSLDDEQARLKSGAEVAGRASRKRDEVRLLGTIRAGVEVDCDRCLKAVEVPVEVEFETSFLPAASAEGATDNVELQAEDLAVSVFEGEAIDVDEVVREQILLALPTRLLCGEECRGLCPTCGADLNQAHCSCERRETDPRWAALASLRKDEE